MLRLNFCKRLINTASAVSTNVLEHLTERTLIRITGKDSSKLLQGLITNDMDHLTHGLGCMYSMFLDTRGRVLYDTIVYKTFVADTFFIECDSASSERLIKHLRMHKIRKKVEIYSLEDEYNLYALFNTENVQNSRSPGKSQGVDGMIVPCSVLNSSAVTESLNSIKVYRDLQIYQDPRVGSLGSRIIAGKTVDVREQVAEITKINDVDTDSDYRWFRYNLGVGEGPDDLPVGSCFPLEANCDYLHGVSFHKGCYLGQELTARTHHTGVVRKRLMPLLFSKIPTQLSEEDKIIHEGVNLGKLRGIRKNVGLALLRIGKALELGQFNVGDGVAETFKPSWWPVEAPKERIHLAKG